MPHPSISSAPTPTIRGWLGPSAPRAPRIDPEIWEQHKDIIVELYKTKPLQIVRVIMDEEFDFKATTRQYVGQFEKWGLYKTKGKQSNEIDFFEDEHPGKRERDTDNFGSTSGAERTEKRQKLLEVLATRKAEFELKRKFEETGQLTPGPAVASGRKAQESSVDKASNTSKASVHPQADQLTVELERQRQNISPRKHTQLPLPTSSEIVSFSLAKLDEVSTGFTASHLQFGPGLPKLASEYLSTIRQPMAAFQLHMKDFEFSSAHAYEALLSLLTVGQSAVTRQHCSILETRLKPFMESTNSVLPSQRFLANYLLSRCAAYRGDSRGEALYSELSRLCGNAQDLLRSCNDRRLDILFCLASSGQIEIGDSLTQQDTNARYHCIRACLAWCRFTTKTSCFSFPTIEDTRNEWGNTLQLFKWLWDQLARDSRSPSDCQWEWYFSFTRIVGITPVQALMFISRYIVFENDHHIPVPSEELSNQFERMLEIGNDVLLEKVFQDVYVSFKINAKPQSDDLQTTLSVFPELKALDPMLTHLGHPKSQTANDPNAQNQDPAESVCADTLLSSLSSVEISSLRLIAKRIRSIDWEPSLEKLKKPSSYITLSSLDDIASLTSSLSLETTAVVAQSA